MTAPPQRGHPRRHSSHVSIGRGVYPGEVATGKEVEPQAGAVHAPPPITQLRMPVRHLRTQVCSSCSTNGDDGVWMVCKQHVPSHGVIGEKDAMAIEAFEKPHRNPVVTTRRGAAVKLTTQAPSRCQWPGHSAQNRDIGVIYFLCRRHRRGARCELACSYDPTRHRAAAGACSVGSVMKVFRLYLNVCALAR